MTYKRFSMELKNMLNYFHFQNFCTHFFFIYCNIKFLYISFLMFVFSVSYILFYKESFIEDIKDCVVQLAAGSVSQK